jgi:hypothetical protein
VVGLARVLQNSLINDCIFSRHNKQQNENTARDKASHYHQQVVCTPLCQQEKGSGHLYDVFTFVDVATQLRFELQMDFCYLRDGQFDIHYFLLRGNIWSAAAI